MNFEHGLRTDLMKGWVELCIQDYNISSLSHKLPLEVCLN